MAKVPSALEGLNKTALKEAVLDKLREQVEAVGATVMTATHSVALGSVVDVQQEDGRRIRYFMLPAGGGMVVGKMVSAATVLQPDSATGKVLMGKRAGDAVRLPGKAGDKDATVLEVA